VVGSAFFICFCCHGLVGGARRSGGFGGFGGFGSRRSAPPQRGPDVAYRLPVAFEDAASLKDQRVTLGSGKTVEIKLPPGVEDGTKIRLAGQGQPGPGGNGDAIIAIDIRPHRFFRREGDNIRLDLPISIDEAVLGGKVRVPTVDGPVMLTVPKGASSGKTLRLKGKGFAGKDGRRGDQMVTLMVEVPAGDEEFVRFVEGWSGKGKGNPRAGLGV
jgi:DnaJ-class molecular chaperone